MKAWINFLRKYGPIRMNENMYDEHIQNSAKYHKIRPIRFDHPYYAPLLQCYQSAPIRNVILTGTAGDGKTHLCREAWRKLGGEAEAWHDSGSVVNRRLSDDQMLYVIKDLSDWAPQQGTTWTNSPDKLKLMEKFLASCLGRTSSVAFLIAANDGQLIDALKRLTKEHVDGAAEVLNGIETLLVEDLIHS